MAADSSDTFKAHGTDVSFAKEECYACHTIVKVNGYIFTSYPGGKRDALLR
jgi:hypothetical protein